MITEWIKSISIGKEDNGKFWCTVNDVRLGYADAITTYFYADYIRKNTSISPSIEIVGFPPDWDGLRVVIGNITDEKEIYNIVDTYIIPYITRMAEEGKKYIEMNQPLIDYIYDNMKTK